MRVGGSEDSPQVFREAATMDGTMMKRRPSVVHRSDSEKSEKIPDIKPASLLCEIWVKIERGFVPVTSRET